MWIVGATRSGWIGYSRWLVQNRCLNIAPVNPVNPVFPVFNIYGVYGIYGHTFLTLILLILLYPRQLPSIPFNYSSPLKGRSGGVSFPISTIWLLCDYYDITMLFKSLRYTLTKTLIKFFDSVKHKSCDKFAHITKKHYLCDRKAIIPFKNWCE